MRVVEDETKHWAQLKELNVGHRGDVVRALNEQHDLVRGSLVCHVYPGNPSLALDLLRSLGKRSDSPGWPKNTSAWGSVEPWIVGANVTDLFVFPADELDAYEIDRLRTLASVRRVWLLRRGSDSSSGLSPRSLLDQIEKAKSEGSSMEAKWGLRDFPDRKFAWPESVILARYEALITMNPTDFREFDDIWTTAKEGCHSLLALSPPDAVSRWLPVMCTKWDGSACSAAASGAFAAFLDEGKDIPGSVRSRIELFRNPIMWSKSTSSPEALASAALTGLGLDLFETEVLRLGQLRVACGQMTILGTRVPTEISSTLLPQLAKRHMAGARSGDLLFPPSRQGLMNQMAARGASWHYHRTPDPKCGTPLGFINFESRAQKLNSLPGANSVRYLRKLLAGPDKHGVAVEKLSNDRRNHSYLLEIGAIREQGAWVRASDALRFSLQRERNDPIRLRAQMTRNTAAIEEEQSAPIIP